MILKINKRKIKVGLDLTKETEKSENTIIQGEINPDMDKIREASKNIGLFFKYFILHFYFFNII